MPYLLLLLAVMVCRVSSTGLKN